MDEVLSQKTGLAFKSYVLDGSIQMKTDLMEKIRSRWGDELKDQS